MKEILNLFSPLVVCIRTKDSDLEFVLSVLFYGKEKMYLSMTSIIKIN